MGWVAIALNVLRGAVTLLPYALVVAVIAFFAHIRSELNRIPTLENQLKESKAAYTQVLGYYKTSEANRKQEQANANRTVSELQTACDGRIAELRRSSTAIRKLTHEQPKVGANNLPSRELFDPRRLSDALGAKQK